MRTLLIFALLFISTLSQLPQDKTPHSYEEIAQKVNSLKTTWKATSYERDFRPLLGTILDVDNLIPEKNSIIKSLTYPKISTQEKNIPTANQSKKCEIKQTVVHVGPSEPSKP